MIKLTLRVGGNVFINIEQIRYFYANEGLPGDTNIVLPDDNVQFRMSHLTVTESPEQVSNLITEYKQRQMRLQAVYGQLYRGFAGEYLVNEIEELESEDRP